MLYVSLCCCHWCFYYKFSSLLFLHITKAILLCLYPTDGCGPRLPSLLSLYLYLCCYSLRISKTTPYISTITLPLSPLAYLHQKHPCFHSHVPPPYSPPSGLQLSVANCPYCLVTESKSSLIRPLAMHRQKAGCLCTGFFSLFIALPGRHGTRINIS